MRALYRSERVVKISLRLHMSRTSYDSRTGLSRGNSFLRFLVGGDVDVKV